MNIFHNAPFSWVVFASFCQFVKHFNIDICIILLLDNQKNHFCVLVVWSVLSFLLIYFQSYCTFPLRISSVNVTKSVVSRGFGHIYWRNPKWKTLFFCAVSLAHTVHAFHPVAKNASFLIGKVFLEFSQNAQKNTCLRVFS